MILITFDIDGTLLNISNNGREYILSYIEAFGEMFFKTDNIREFIPKRTCGMTDLAVAKYTVDHVVPEKSTEEKEAIVQKFISLVEDKFIKNFTGDQKLANGVHEFLETLKSRGDIVLGLCTGNLPRVGIEKMKKAGLLDFFDESARGFGWCEGRAELLKMVISRVEEKYSCKMDKVIHIGDTCSDIEAAEAAGAIPVLIKQWNMDKRAVCESCTVKDYIEGRETILKLL